MRPLLSNWHWLRLYAQNSRILLAVEGCNWCNNHLTWNLKPRCFPAGMLPSWVLTTPSAIRRFWLACSSQKLWFAQQGMPTKRQNDVALKRVQNASHRGLHKRSIQVAGMFACQQRDAGMYLECLLPGCPLAHSALQNQQLLERVLMLAQESCYSKQFHIRNNHSSYLALNLPIEVSCTSLPPLALACEGCHMAHSRWEASFSHIHALAAAIFTTSASDVGICINLKAEMGRWMWTEP